MASDAVAQRIRVWYSPRMVPHKYHVDPECPGLEHVAEERRASDRVPSWYAMVRHDDGRPCRHCTLETALVHVWQQPALQRGGLIPVTFSSQGRLDETRYFGVSDPWEVTESGAARLRRLGARLDIPVIETCVGPVCVTFVAKALGTVLARNLRTYRIDDAVRDRVVDPLAVDAFWSLVSSAPPELTVGALDPPTVWTVAHAMMGPTGR